jgi:hypothetical protein
VYIQVKAREKLSHVIRIQKLASQAAAECQNYFFSHRLFG